MTLMKQHTCRFDDKLFESLEKLAALKNLSINWIVNEFVRLGIDGKKQEWLETKKLLSIAEGEKTTRQKWDQEMIDKFGN